MPYDTANPMPPPPAPLLRMSGITKSFGRQQVLRDVPFELHRGEVHVLAGENGAGKSTLMKILGGVYTDYEGRIELHGRPVRFRSPREAAACGVAIIHQELSLVRDLSVEDNLFLGHEHSTLGWLRRGSQRQRATDVLTQLGVRLDIRRPVGSFSIATQQLIEIAKALALEADLLVMDEPTSALQGPEVERLFACIAGLKARGCGIVYITHRMEEVYRLADRITVLRDGNYIGTSPMAELPAPLLVRQMVGRDLAPPAGLASDAVADLRLRLENFTLRGVAKTPRPVVDGVSLDLRAGEIVGLAGLEGSGNSALLWGLFGAHAGRASGRVLLDGHAYVPTSPRRAIRRGLALVTNDRQRTGLVLGLSVAQNFTLASLPKVSPGGWLNGAAERRTAERLAQALELRAGSLRQPVGTLSGGNQQKVVLGKWLNVEPRVLLLDEPTRGVDVGAKQEIYALMKQCSRTGAAILLITSELSELLLLSNRIIVLHRGRVSARLDRGEATPERVLHAAMGGN